MGKALRKILIVDDDRAIRTLLASCLRHDFTIREASDGPQALVLSAQFQPDLALVDVSMPGMSGYEVCRRLKMGQPYAVPHVIMVSARSSRDDQLRAYEVGGDDYVVKPLDIHEMRARINLHFRLRDSLNRTASLRDDLALHHTEVQAAESQSTQEIVAIQDAAIFALAQLAGSLDYDDTQHVLRLREYTQLLAEQLADVGPYCAQIDCHFIEDLHRSSPLHDIGKAAISDAILLKPDKLSEAEYQQMMRHTIIGSELLGEAVAGLRGASFLSLAAIVARSHHEWWDGSGYPDGLAGCDIPLAARIVAVADVYEALTSKRPYRRAFTRDSAKALIMQNAGQQFDPVVVRAFEHRWKDFIGVQERYNSEQRLVTGIWAIV
jgi:putative two-component system response regulator